ncbi:hypothetical protein OHB26_31015 [Nocardia sp. NBC_01503]|uniref:hypothetical protein n=1 Tax=Nocardia sp. NBC_01503 TaxID=2975997 RepID=UPI002E7AE3A2|nr:hypothetical protein [Nocardia sp. NBC_01503]WTL31309.1 hypothetical protein OHB26_31015 [Nocardia sp. NBC_01503]
MIDREIVDRIDRLVGDQLAAYESRSWYHAPRELCPHCGRDWHGLPITERMEQMRLVHTFDEGYRYARDTSRVLCPGAMFVGPSAPEPPSPNGFDVLAAWRDMVWAARDSTPISLGSRTGGEIPEIGVTGGCDRAAWHCPRCDTWSAVVETISAANAFATALQSYASHIARRHEIELVTPFDTAEFATRFGLPLRGLLWDADHRVIGRYGPGGSHFEDGHTARELKGFGATLPGPREDQGTRVRVAPR